MNTSMLLDMAAEAGGDRIALGSRHGGLTAADVLIRAKRAATLFARAGVQHVGFLDLNSNMVPIALFGAGLAGLPFAPVNYRLTDDKLRAIVQRLAPGLVIAGGDVIDRIAGIDGITLMSSDDFATLVEDESAPIEDDLPFVDPEEIAVLLFTSGTTGEPKAAVLRHRHLTSYIISTVEFLAADTDDAQLVSVPAYHIAGMSAVLSSVFSGRRIFYIPAFEAEAWVQAARDENISQAMVVPTMLGRILQLLDGTGGLPHLKHLSYGGGRMPVELIERAIEQLPHVNFVNAYGLTETSSTVSVLGPEDHRTAMASTDPAVRKRLASVGRPFESIEVEIRGAGGEVLPTGERGEVYVRGEQVAGEYLGRSVLTEDGWFPTNDAGYLDDEGFLFLEGRLDDVIVRGAENLSPGEIEDALLSHAAVADAGVVGIPHPEWGETVAAAVVLEPGMQVTQADLQAWVRARLRSTKTPEVIDFRAELPYNETGKLLRRVLKAELS